MAFGTAAPPDTVAVTKGDGTNYALLDNGRVISKDGDLVLNGMLSTNPQDMPIPDVAAIIPEALIRRDGAVLFRPVNSPMERHRPLHGNCGVGYEETRNRQQTMRQRAGMP